MPDDILRRLNNHPSGRLAAEFLAQMEEPVDPSRLHLLHLALAYLEGLPSEPDGTREEVLQLAREMETKGPFLAASLLAPDYEQLTADLEQGRELLTLEAHLNSLLPDLQAARSARRAGSLLAENLYHNLQHLFPSFGRRSR